MKLNVDGSMTEDLETAGEGGLAKDENGIWQGGFVAKLMCISIDEAEAWALLHGLQMAWDMGIKRLIVKTDSLSVQLGERFEGIRELPLKCDPRVLSLA